MKILQKVFLALGLGALMAGSAMASLAVDFSTVTEDGNSGNWCLGFQFNTNDYPLRVTHLGFYDDGKNGLTESHDVGIFDSVGNLVVSTTVEPGAPLTGWFRFYGITPYTLAANQTYFIQAVVGAENFTFFLEHSLNGFGVDPGITFVTDAYHADGPGFDIPGGVLAPPNEFSTLIYGDGEAGYFGPNFQYTVVPLPNTALLLGAGLGFLTLYRGSK